MPNIPPTAWAIGALAVLYIAVRIWATRAEDRRRAAHEERMQKLMAEREAAQLEDESAAEPPDSAIGPGSLAAVTSDKDPKPERAASPQVPQVKVRCRACKTLNDESATTCAECGAEL